MILGHHLEADEIPAVLGETIGPLLDHRLLLLVLVLVLLVLVLLLPGQGRPPFDFAVLSRRPNLPDQRKCSIVIGISSCRYHGHRYYGRPRSITAYLGAAVHDLHRLYRPATIHRAMEDFRGFFGLVFPATTGSSTRADGDI